MQYFKKLKIIFSIYLIFLIIKYSRDISNLVQNPRQKEKFKNTILTIVVISIVSILIPTTVANLDRPEEAIQTALFCGTYQIHLFLLSLPGQMLLDHCSDLANNIYDSTWYRTPVQIQKLSYVMQIRCKKFCSLTAGGLYEMNVENFGITFKTCMSYITVLMSLKD